MKHAYSRFLSADPQRLHFAAHSHHFWPDCTREAQLAYWDDSARLADHKWEHVFSDVIPRAQKHIARQINIDDPASIVFAPNTHELATRLLSCFDLTRPLRILTTDSEFHSFTRQSQRLAELPNVMLERVATEPFDTFDARFIAAAEKSQPDFVFVSQVFFNSGFEFKSINTLVDKLRDTTAMIVIDGYHAFAALPVDFSKVQDRAFYLAGGYKYAQAGEGACFLHVPKFTGLARPPRPLNTGWYATFTALEKGTAPGETPYGLGASRFWGSTFDPSGLYRMNAVFDWWTRDGITSAKVHTHVMALQKNFLAALGKTKLGNPLAQNAGHFLTFRTQDAKDLHDMLRAKNVVVDYRGDRLRFGFGLYHDEQDVEKLAAALKPLI